MSEPRDLLSDLDLERRLAELGPLLAVPPAPDLAAAVSARLTLRQAPHRPLRVFFAPRLLAPAAVLLLVLAAGVVLLTPGLRSAVADRLGFQSDRITVVPTLPPLPRTPPSASPAATPAPPGAGLALGEQTTLDQARARLSFPLLVPTAAVLGPPDAVWLSAAVPGGQVALTYGVGSGLPPTTQTGLGALLTEFRGGIDPAFFGKVVGPGTTVEPVSVGGDRGWWLAGKPHILIYQAPDGQIRNDQIRLAGDTLLWQHGDVILRLESSLSRDEAIRVAESVR